MIGLVVRPVRYRDEYVVETVNILCSAENYQSRITRHLDEAEEIRLAILVACPDSDFRRTMIGIRTVKEEWSWRRRKWQVKAMTLWAEHAPLKMSRDMSPLHLI